MKAITKRMQAAKAMMKFMLKKQNPDLAKNDVEKVIAQALGNESSVVGLCSFTGTS